jgi:hypothetical protein
LQPASVEGDDQPFSASNIKNLKELLHETGQLVLQKFQEWFMLKVRHERDNLEG